MATRALISMLAVVMAVSACRGGRSEYEERPAADTQPSAPVVAQTGAEPADSSVADTTSPPTAPDTSASLPQVGADTGFVGTTEPIHRAGSAPPPVATLREVRAGQHAEYDRLVFEFASPPIPGYHIEYAAGPVYQCGSGDEVSVPGAARLVVRLQPARAHDDGGNVTIAERQRALALPNIKHLSIICDFEAQVEWVAALRARTPYRVAELSEPPRLVVDIHH